MFSLAKDQGREIIPSGISKRLQKITNGPACFSSAAAEFFRRTGRKVLPRVGNTDRITKLWAFAAVSMHLMSYFKGSGTGVFIIG